MKGEGRPAPGGSARALGAMTMKVIDEFEYIVGATALLGLVVLLTISILARYVSGISVPWSEELARFVFITVIFATISYSARERRHVRVTLFVEKLFSDKGRLYIFTIGDLVWLGFNAAVLYGAWEILSEMIRWPYSSPVLDIPMYYVYALIPIFFVTLSIRVIQGIALRHRGVDIDSHTEEAI